MQPEELKAMVEAELPNSVVTVRSDGSHYELTVVSDAFAGKSRLQREQMVNACLADIIRSGAIHAVNIRPHTPDEWASASKLQIS